MKKKILLSAVVLALTGCSNDDGYGIGNFRGSASLSGDARVGETLSVSITDKDGVKSGTDVYTWMADGATIAGATASAYVLTEAEAGKQIRVTVAYSDERNNKEETRTQTSEPVIGNEDGVLTLTGVAETGATLTATLADGNGIDPSAVVYSWLADGAVIDGATESSYAIADTDVGKTITAKADYTDRDGFSESVLSATTDPVKVANTPGMVSIDKQAPIVDDVLTATVADDNGTEGVAISYQWLADGVAIDGATSPTFSVTSAQLDKALSVQATYTDQAENAEDIVSEQTAPVAAALINVPGSVSLDQFTKLVVGQTVTAMVDDDNGASGTINYQWQADGVDIAGANSAEYVVAATDAGKVLSVVANYIDDAGFEETGHGAEAEEIAYSKIVNNFAELMAAFDGEVEGDVIGMAPGDYSNAGLLTVDVKDLHLTRTADAIAASGTAIETAALSGEVCFEILATADGSSAADGVKFDHLHFADFNYVKDTSCDTDSSSDDYYINNKAAYFSLTNTLMENEANTSSSSTSWVYVGGSKAHVARNTFSGKVDGKKGSFIRVSANGLDEESNLLPPAQHVVEYNLFQNFDASGQSSGYGMQLGDTTGTNSVNTAGHVLRYNLFDGILAKTRVVKVQTSGSYVYGNTFANTYGMVSLENGQQNTVYANVFIGMNGNKYESGVNAAAYGHVVSNNYFAGQASDSDSERASLVLTSNENSDSGNSTLETSATEFSHNTIVNSMAPFMVGAKGCSDTPLTSAVSMANLLLNDYAPAENTELTGINGATKVDDGSLVDDCDKATVTFENDHYYSDETVGGSAASKSVSGTGVITAAAPATAPVIDANGFVQGAGDDAGIGADTSKLYRIKASDVGVGSTWESEIDHSEVFGL
ncbi:hypothetical protein GCM10011369_21310 [Neiella marina]|uniref:Poly(Beta-D-mannuronate) lyase n=1 Tax=Neiella marina TaxID=508461 RepID=A0A8J2XPD0_9GAMM|nr:chondroitinase-B domain-containing protein [Neiella marina]GGA79080.1 hypothetical protein GCM10011369_21310 [Neiella marina]